MQNVYNTKTRNGNNTHGKCTFTLHSFVYSTSIGDDCSIQMYGQVRKHGITDPVGSSGSLYLFIRFSFPVLIAMMYFKLLYRVVFGCYDVIFDRICYAFR